ncbi:2-amino-4-hydroxy-6-hydroxymethyldihydropteridine diphosphokinase [Sphingobacterium sp. LRF_L2]|uniref:2-amino-4-hydroxy-6- hydroxymethyldihydropteridine diphosphokinase n=1 Tax=Sphingobacterium sp. LRF_L2 TaxID=3369421 RepID=UPI003F5EC1AE
MNTVFLLLGANLGDPTRQLTNAIKEIEQRVGQIESLSSIYESKAWGVIDQPNFLNQIAVVLSPRTALEILDEIQAIENELGRVRLAKWGARLIDIDILYFNNESINHERLIVPHPYLQDRNFTLKPLVELAPHFIHPVLQKSNLALLEMTEDTLDVHLYEPKS